MNSGLKDNKLLVYWNFDKIDDNGLILEHVSNEKDSVIGYGDLLKGVKGNALRIDGYTTHIKIPNNRMPKSLTQLTISAWIANGAHPWANAPIIENLNEAEGFFFGVNAENFILLIIKLNGEKYSVQSKIQLPNFKWAHIAGVFDAKKGLSLYFDGELVETTKFDFIQDSITIPDDEFSIGRAKIDVKPTFGVGPMNLDTPIYLDAIIDELKVFGTALSGEEIKVEFSKIQSFDDPDFEKRGLPTVSEKNKRFGAFYTTLKYYKEWDRLWRVRDHADVVVTFDDSSNNFVFWRGLNYIPAWTCTKNIWYTNEFNETWPEDEPKGRCSEPMSDKQCRTSHVRIIESNDARVVVHWRYALIDNMYQHARVDELTGWGDWSDEYYVIYPDGVGIRDINLHSSQPMEPHEFQESIVILGEGLKPEDAYNTKAVTFFNLKGESHTYDWSNGSPMFFMEPRNKNIEIINTKSDNVPFFIIPDGPCITANKFFCGKKRRNPSFSPYGSFPKEFREKYSKWPWWAAWPALLHSDATVARTTDRMSHTNVSSGAEWEDYEVGENLRRRIMLHGMWPKTFLNDLPQLGKSWLKAPEIKIESKHYENEGYFKHERAYHFKLADPQTVNPLEFTINASEDNPLVNPAFVINNLDGDIELFINGKSISRGKNFRYSTVNTINESKIVIWIKFTAIKPCNFEIKPEV